MRLIFGFLAALIVTYIVAVLGYTQLNLANLTEMGVKISLGVRFESAIHDLVGMIQIYLPILAASLLIAFSVAEWLASRVKELRVLFFISFALLVPSAIDFLLTFSFWGLNILQNIHPIAVTRTTAGVLSQSFACALGGFVFCFIVSSREADD